MYPLGITVAAGPHSTQLNPITKMTQNKTDLYTKESAQQNFYILNVRFERAYYQNFNNEIQQKGEQEKPLFMIVMFQNIIISYAPDVLI